MARKMKVAASILACDFSKLRDEVKKCEDAGIDLLHIDVMDGHFVPNLTIGPVIIDSIRPYTNLPIDSHLMIENPGMYIKDYVEAGSDIVTVHIESYGEYRPASRGTGKFPKEVDSIDSEALLKDLKKIKSSGTIASVTLNPGTPLSCIQGVLKDVDKVLIMSVNPGFAGQKFMNEVVPKIKDLRKVYDKDIEVDGGMNAETVPIVIDAGANIIVTASYFFKSKDPKEAVKVLKEIGEKR